MFSDNFFSLNHRCEQPPTLFRSSSLQGFDNSTDTANTISRTTK